MYKPDANDISRLKQIWKEVFKDTDDYIDLYFSEKFSPEKTLVYRNNGVINSALYYSDVIFSNNVRAAYICGISTVKEMRGQGQASVLINECLNELKLKGYDIAFLIPASPSLFNFYKKFGFEVFSYLNKDEFTIKGKAETKRKSSEICAEIYNNLNLIKPVRTEHDFNVLDKCYGYPYVFNDGYIYGYKSENAFIVAEHSFTDRSRLSEAFSTITDKKTNIVKVNSPVNVPIGERTPFSVFINFKDVKFNDDIYINLMLN